MRINRSAEKISNNSRYGFIGKTGATEIYALIRFIYLRGLSRQNYHAQKLLFKDKIDHPIFAAVLSKNRFSLFPSNLMFDGEEECAASWPHDRFADIRNLFELFNQNCLNHVIPS